MFPNAVVGISEWLYDDFRLELIKICESKYMKMYLIILMYSMWEKWNWIIKLQLNERNYNSERKDDLFGKFCSV